jgi:hypothetical protein
LKARRVGILNLGRFNQNIAMKKIIVFLLISILFQGFAFSQTQEELDLEMEEELNEVRIKVEEEKIFKVVKSMHHFPGCEGQGKSKKELQECSEHKMQEFIYSHIKYPAKARGTVKK